MNTVHPDQSSVGAPAQSGGQPAVIRRSRDVSWQLSLLIGLLRFTAQIGEPGCCPLLYATFVYLLMTATTLPAAWINIIKGIEMLATKRRFFEALFESTFFGMNFILMWMTLSVTFFVGRRRTAALLKDALDVMEDVSCFYSYPSQRARSDRRTTGMLLLTVSVFIVGLFSYGMAFSAESVCSTSISYCVLILGAVALCCLVFFSFLMASIKYALLCSILVCGFDTVNSELKAVKDSGWSLDWTRLRRLRMCQARLSDCFSLITRDLSPELTSSMIYGTLAQVITYFMLIKSINDGTIIANTPPITLFLIPAAIGSMTPCMACQDVVDRVAVTRDTLLALEPPEDSKVDRQVAAFLAAVQRDVHFKVGPLLSVCQCQLVRLSRSTS